MTEIFNMPDKNNDFEHRGGWVAKSLMIDLKISLNQACGIVGNIGYESGGFKELQEISPEISGSAGGYGWAQWTGPRRRAYEFWCKSNNIDPASDQANYEYLVLELKTSMISTIVALRKTETLHDAVWSVGQTYERPGGTTNDNLPGFEGRLAYAEKALNGANLIMEAKPLITSMVENNITSTDQDSGLTATSVDPEILEFHQECIKIQTFLREKNLYNGQVDGDFGPQSRLALEKYLQTK